jgi:hypothetical protein
MVARGALFSVDVQSTAVAINTDQIDNGGAGSLAHEDYW